jgi:uncharacterized Zn finger protein (UPF0148 family)
MNCPRCKQPKLRFDTGVCYKCVLKSVAEAEAIYRQVIKQKKRARYDHAVSHIPDSTLRFVGNRHSYATYDSE